MTTLWEPITVGSMHLLHRLALSPMTRSRALPDCTPGPLAADYYRQRASLGLLITEGTQPVVRAVAGEIGATRTALRISPNGPLGGLDEGPEGPDLYRYLVGELAPLGLAYLNVFSFAEGDELLRDIRAAWPGAILLIRAGRSVMGTPASEREPLLAADLDAGLADMVPLGSSALANPDVVERLQTGAPLNDPDPATFYGGGAAGYVDYPALVPSPGTGE